MTGTKITTKDVLKVFAAGGIVVSAAVIPSIPISLGMIIKDWEKANKSDLGRIITRLKIQQMIRISDVNGKTKIAITDKGKHRLLEYDYENIGLRKMKRDKNWRLIIFDIPESKKKNRNAFIRKLAQINCIRLQDSVYVSAYPCLDEINFLCHYLEISDYVTVLTVRNFERGEELFFKNITID